MDEPASHPVPPPHSASVLVAAPPEVVWALVSDVERTGEFSPACTSCTWEDGGGPRPGAWFTGTNTDGRRTWTTRSVVEDADPPRRFSWLVFGGSVRWAYDLDAVPGGTRLTERWEFLPAGVASFHERFGEHAQRQVDLRTAGAHETIPVTLAALKAAAEAQVAG